MFPHLTVLVVALGVAVAAPKAHKNHWSCHESPRGARFEEQHAVGTWILLRMKTEATNAVDNTHCVDFSRVNEEERNGLKELIAQYVENLEWKNITLKMQIPCAQSNATRRATYFLERLEDHGSYRTLQMPANNGKFDLAEFHRYPMRLKLLEGRYLHMLDCVDHVAFLMGRTHSVDDRLRTLLDAFWPDDASPVNQL
ncbi:uncharacterized protein LOC134805098 [Cydia splendana]|uniref:uncharacterized protein LOC134805098 n=1 Tax=Cydia splendana TaxID=1100963 RepID=UPI0028F49D24